jgi:phosphate-selective porin OprO/OprP
MKGKSLLMTGVAVVALVASADAGLAKSKHHPAPAASASAPSTSSPSAPAAGPSNADLATRIDTLEAELAAEQDRRSGDHNRLSALEQNFNDVTWTFDNGRPTIKSGDGRFSMSIRARFQADFAGFSQDSTHPAGFAGPGDLSSGAVFRRAYIGIEGKAYNDFSYELRLNVGGTNGGLGNTPVPAGTAGAFPTAGEGDPLLNKAVVTYTGIPNWHLNVGVIEPAFMFEGTTSSASLIFLERPEIDNIAADTFGAGDSRRGVELGFQKTDTLWAGDNLAATVTFSGQKTGSANNHGNGGDENTQILGRVSERLWTDGLSNVQIGFSGAHIFNTGSVQPGGVAGSGCTTAVPPVCSNGGTQQVNLQDRPEIRVDGTRLISTGGINAKTADMIALDFGGNWENFFLGGEYAEFMVDRAPSLGSAVVVDHPNFAGWYIEGSWILTGESKAYSAGAINNEVGGFNAPVPSRPFSFSGDSWGAWEIALRYSDTDLNWHTGVANGVFGGDERVFAVALNWYLNRNVRVMLDDNIVTVKKGTLAIPNRDGQDVNIVGLRVQFAN